MRSSAIVYTARFARLRRPVGGTRSRHVHRPRPIAGKLQACQKQVQPRARLIPALSAPAPSLIF